MSSFWPRVLLDFTVWDNDGAYVLVTFVSIVFAIVLIVTVSRQSRAHDRLAPPRSAASAVEPPTEGESAP